MSPLPTPRPPGKIVAKLQEAFVKSSNGFDLEQAIRDDSEKPDYTEVEFKEYLTFICEKYAIHLSPKCSVNELFALAIQNKWIKIEEHHSWKTIRFT